MNGQVFFRALGFQGEAEVIDLWTMQSLGTFASHYPGAYAQSPSIPPHGNLLVQIKPTQGKASATPMEHDCDCPAWGCQAQRKWHDAWVQL